MFKKLKKELPKNSFALEILQEYALENLVLIITNIIFAVAFITTLILLINK